MKSLNVNLKLNTINIVIYLVISLAAPQCQANVGSFFAGIWNAITSCVEDPCNCGYENPPYANETWDGIPKSYKMNPNCPPWNRNDGRQGCLYGQAYPHTEFLKPLGYYENLCGESTRASGYFNPKIKVRGQQCNVFACWTTSHTLGIGECVTLASGYGMFPLHRMCARVAFSSDPFEKSVETVETVAAQTGNFNWSQSALDGLKEAQDLFAYNTNITETSMGYTENTHLNSRGETVPDPQIIGKNGDIIKFNPPKLCLYKDAAFWDVSQDADGSQNFDIDWFDVNPNYQPFHKTTRTHPVMQTVIFLLNMKEKLETIGIDILAGAFGTIEGDSDGAQFGQAIGDIFRILGEASSTTYAPIIYALREIGQINRAVTDRDYGCVLLELGPYPPPFCPKLLPYVDRGKIQAICKQDTNGNFEEATANNSCVRSDLINNSIRNSVRVGYDNLFPLCSEEELLQPPSDKCVRINDIENQTASLIHTLPNSKKDLIKKCANSPAQPGDFCIDTIIPDTCSVSSDGCNEGYRIVYGIKYGDTIQALDNYRDDLEDCSGGTGNCQTVWGVNMGDFKDVSLVFDQVENSYNTNVIEKDFSMQDQNQESYNWKLKITKKIEEDTLNDFTQDPNQICAFSDNFIVGCTDRASLPRPVVTECTDPSATGASCSSTFFEPKFIISIKDGNDRTSAVMAPKNVFNSSNGKMNLGGYEFEAVVTDDDYTLKAFSGPRAYNPITLFGYYKDDKYPVTSDFKPYKAAIYHYGLEYINDKYHFGGKKACLLNNLSSTVCPADTSQCVLTKLINSDNVSCREFTTIMESYSPLGLCANDTDFSGCTVVNSIKQKNNPTLDGIIIHECGSEAKHCYTNVVSSGVKVCEISFAASDRYIPDPSVGETLLNDTDYYNVHDTSGVINTGQNYDKDLYYLRNKTERELSACVAVPQGNCAEITETQADISHGYATWPETAVGEIATGTCKTNYIPPTDPTIELKRYCVPTDSKTFEFETLLILHPLTGYPHTPSDYGLPDNGLPPYGYIYIYNNVKCDEAPPTPLGFP